MNFKFLTVSLLALSVAATVTLTGCQREEATTIETPAGEEVVVPPEGAETTEVNIEDEAAAPAAEGEAVAPAAEGEAAAPAATEEAHAPAEGEAAH